MSELFHECGVAAVYHLNGAASPLLSSDDPIQASRLIPRMLLDMQNRGQLSAGMTTYRPDRGQLIDTYKEIGSVQEVFRLSHPGKTESLMSEYAGLAAIGHVRYATCGKDDRSYAQPFERHHIEKGKWFSFAFNGQLANYSQLRDQLLNSTQHHLAREADTEILMHEISRFWSHHPPRGRTALVDMMKHISSRIDGAYSLAYLNAHGEMMIARDPLGIKPMCFARRGPLVAAASESVALSNLGFERDELEFLPPGHMLTVVDDEVRIDQFAENCGQAFCFFEWIYFANVASNLDGRSVYLARTALGAELARLEQEDNRVIIDEDTIVVPVPDTSKAAADSMAYHLGIPSREGLIRNRYSGRTFIEGEATRESRARIKYTPLRDVLNGKRVILVEDSIVRSTTMQVLLSRIYEVGAREIHVRVACPPIIAPCYYGIDMSTLNQLFAPQFVNGPPSANPRTTEQIHAEMAERLKCDSLRYLPLESISKAIGFAGHRLCQACITGQYPTAAGQRLYQLDLVGHLKHDEAGRPYEVSHTSSARPDPVARQGSIVSG